MSSFPLFSPEAARRTVAAAVKSPALVFERLPALPKLAEVIPASKLVVRPAPEMVSSGVSEIDALTGGLPRGCLSEICGAASSGRTSLLLAVLAAATRRQETCALVDVSDAFDPTSAAMAGVSFAKLLWVRCSPQTTRPPRRHGDTEKNKKYFDSDRMETPVEQALRVTDLLLQSGGFGVVIIDLGDVPLKTARRIPLTSWFRFQRAVEHTPTVLFVVTPAPCAQTCAALLLKVRARSLAVGPRSLAKKLSAISSQPPTDSESGSNLSVVPEGTQVCSTLDFPALPCRANEWRRCATGAWFGFPEEQKSSCDTDFLPPEAPSHAQLLEGLHVEGELLRSRLGRKPVQSVTAFSTKAIGTG